MIGYDQEFNLCHWERGGQPITLAEINNRNLCIATGIEKLKLNPYLIGVLVPFFKMNRLPYHEMCLRALGDDLHPLGDKHRYRYRQDGRLDLFFFDRYIGIIKTNGDRV